MQDQKFDMQTTFAEAVRCYSEGRLDEALALFNSLLLRQPQGAPRWFAIIGNINLKQGNPLAAADAFVREAAISPDLAAPLLKNAVAIYHQNGMAEKLSEVALRAIVTNPGDNAVAFQAIHALVHTGRLDAAETVLHLLDMTEPRQVSVAYEYHIGRGNPEEAFKVLTEGLKSSPTDGYLLSTRFAEARKILDLDTMREYADLMSRLDEPLPSTLLAIERVLTRLYWSTSEAVNARPSIETLEIAAATAAHAKLPRRPISPAGSKLKIGYLSNDFHNHVVMSVLLDILKLHDRDQFGIHLFCYTPPQSATAQKDWPAEIRDAILHVYDWDSGRIAQAISDRQIDILVDLKGHTAAARLDILNLSDAPLKVGYLGYPSGTTGVDLDYAITDRYITPDSSKPHFHEKLCRLPGSLMPNRPLASLMPGTTTREAYGLPPSAFVFCSFNAIAKLSLRTIEMWTRILKTTPHSILWIRCDLEAARRNLLKEFTANGVKAEQIVFAQGTQSYEDHITRLTLAHLALDPTPYNGHVTTTDMLRAGLPVLTVRGTTCSSRMTEGQLSVLGLPELIADDDNDYIAKAVEFAGDTGKLAVLRSRLSNARASSSLFDPVGYTRHLEKAFEIMASRARNGLSPDHMDVPEIAKADG